MFVAAPDPVNPATRWGRAARLAAYRHRRGVGVKVCIFGAGAIGGFIGARLAAAGGCEVSAVARGATLAALRARGWRLQQAGRELGAPAHASDDPRELGAQDVVVVAVKATAMDAVADSVAPLLAPGTIVVPAMNGVPWWFAQALPVLGGRALASVDPGGRIAASIGIGQVVGCVVHASCSTPEPGVVAHRMGNGLIVGEPRGGGSERVEGLAALLRGARFEVTVSDDVRGDVWYKLWGNMTMNPVTAMTGASADRVLDDALVRDFCSRVMAEAAEVGVRIGCAIAQSAEDRHAVTRRLGAFRTSMLQDVEAGRALELDALLGAVREIAARVDVATPNLDALFGMSRLFARVRGLYPEAQAATGRSA
jgi:2-dehydropantoate 2-reductase